MFFSDFYNNLTDIYNRNIIVDKSLESRRNVYDKPWMSTSLAKCYKEKNRLHNVWIKSRGSSYENLAKLNYKSYRRILRGFIRKSVNDYYMSKFNKVSGNIRKAWSVMNSIRCKNKSLRFPSCVDINSMIISNRRIICHKFNEYFTNVADKLNKGKYKDFTPLSYTEFFPIRLS